MEKMIQKTVTNTVIMAAKIEDGELVILGESVISGVRAGIDAAAKKVREDYGDFAVVMSMSYEVKLYKMPVTMFIQYADEVAIEVED